MLLKSGTCTNGKKGLFVKTLDISKGSPREQQTHVAIGDARLGKIMGPGARKIFMEREREREKGRQTGNGIHEEKHLAPSQHVIHEKTTVQRTFSTVVPIFLFLEQSVEKFVPFRTHLRFHDSFPCATEFLSVWDI